MATLIILSLCLLNIGTSLFAPKVFILLTLLIGDIPFSFLSEGRGFIGTLGGLAGSGVVELSVVVGSFVVICVNPSRGLPILLSRAVHLFFLLFAALSLMWTADLIYGIRMLVKLAAPLLFLAACASCLRSSSDLRRFEKAILWSGILSLALALSNYMLKYAPGFISGGITYLTVPGSSPAPFSFHMGIAALVALENFLHSRSLRYLGLTAIFGGAVFLAFTRISMAALIVGASLIFFSSARSKVLATAFPLILCSAFVVAVFVQPTLRARMFQNPQAVSAGAIASDPASSLKKVHGSGRFAAWGAAIHRFFYPSPLIGSGVGATQAFYYEETRQKAGAIHSEYLRILCEMGVIGLGLFVITMFGYLVSMARRTLHSVGWRRSYAVMAFGCLLFYLITLITDNSLDYMRPLGNYVFGLVAAALLAFNRKFEEATTVSSAFSPKSTVSERTS